MRKSLAGKELGQGITQRKDEWFDIWIGTCKKNCRNTTRVNYTHSYNHIRESLGWRKLNNINLITMQQAFNGLKTDMSRKDTRRIIIDMFNKAIDADFVRVVEQLVLVVWIRLLSK